MSARFIQGTLMLAGMIIGVGMFGIPYTFVQSGFWVGAAELAVLALVIGALHIIYGSVVLATPDFHRLPGYVNLYLGKRAAAAAFFSAFFGIVGTLLAYILLGGIFLNQIAGRVWGGSSDVFWTVAIAAAAAAVTILPLRGETLINGILTALLIGFVVFLSVYFLPHVRIENLAGYDLKNIFMPYGVLLFALSGGVVIPDLITYLGRDRRLVRRAIIIGTAIPAILYFFFAFAAVGALGVSVSEEAVRSLGAAGGSAIVLAGSAIGFLAIFTSLIVLGMSFQAMLRLDFGVGRIAAWGIGALLPLALFFLGFQDFLGIIGAVGAIGVGIDALLVIAAYYRVRKAADPAFASAPFALKFGPIYALVVAGIGYELYRFFAL